LDKVWYDRIPFANELFPIVIGMHSRLSPAHHTGPKYSWHEQLEVLYITEGEVLCECDFKKYVCRKGDIVVINPYDAHVVEYLDREAYFLCLMVDPKLYDGTSDISGVKYTRPMSDRRLRFKNHIRDNPRIEQIFIDLYKEYQSGEPAYEMAVKGHLLRFLSELYRTEIAEDSGTSAYRGGISPALTYISEHYTDDISLEDLAASCNMNPSYFCRRFRDITGRTAITYVNEYRLTKAHGLLLASDNSISQIATACGFSDGNYFSRVFSKYYGMSPMAMRNSSKKENAYE